MSAASDRDYVLSHPLYGYTSSPNGLETRVVLVDGWADVVRFSYRSAAAYLRRVDMAAALSDVPARLVSF